MSYPTKIAFPCPPPTTNSLTSQQRSQLLRTTQKLGRLLGSTPALIEESDAMPSMLPLNLQRLAVPLHIQLSSVYSDEDHGLYPSPSSDSGSGSERSSPTSSLKRSSSLSSQHSYSTRSGTPTTTKSVHVNDAWPAERPFLRIRAQAAPGLEAIPQSPPPYSADAPQSHHTSFTIRPAPAARYPAGPPAPAFTMPSQNSVRRAKMDKLRRTLGDGVPLGLVFPERSPTGSSDSDLDAEEEEEAAAPRRRAPQPQRIRTARDSLVGLGHGRALNPQATRPAPPPPPMVPSPRELKKLSIIAEHPYPRGSTESERYQGDSEGDFPKHHRRGSAMYDGCGQGDARRIKRVPVPSYSYA
ncbi:hypothetical protein C8R46DRAFT_1359116 [Mycena filopes]|nr:hypothetical protein C8R46DRAFT_1359116 [Mycena filopes]